MHSDNYEFPSLRTESLDSKNGSERCMNKTVLLFKANSPTKMILRSETYFLWYNKL